MPKTTFVDRGMQLYLGKLGSNVSQFDPTGQVSPGQNYVPDEVARMIVKEAGLGKADTISKRAIVGFLESMGLSAGLAPDVAIVLRNSYGVTPTFDEDVEEPRSGQLLEELGCVVNESYPAPFMVMGPQVLTEEEAYRSALVEEYDAATNENDREVYLALSEVSLNDAQEIAMFGEWAGPEVLECLWDLVEAGLEPLAHEVIEGLVRPHLIGRLSEDAQQIVEALTPFGREGSATGAFDKRAAKREKHQAAKGEKSQARKQLKLHAKDLGHSASSDPLATKAAAKAAGKNVPAAKPMGKSGEERKARMAAKAAGTSSPPPSEAPSSSKETTQGIIPTKDAPEAKPGRLRSGAKKAIELGKKINRATNIKGTEPGFKGALKAVGRKGLGAVAGTVRGAAHAVGAVGSSAVGGFAQGVKSSYQKQKAIQRGEDPAGAQQSSQKSAKSDQPEKKHWLKRLAGGAARVLSRAAGENPGISHVSKDVSSKKGSKGAERRKDDGGGAVSGLKDGVARSGNLIGEMIEIFGGQSMTESVEDDVRSPAEVIEGLEADDVVDQTVLECLSEMSWDDLAQLANIVLMPVEESFALLRSLAEGTGFFRDEWKSVEERTELPTGMTRSTFVTLSKVSIDEGTVPKVVFWSGCALQEGGPVVEEYVRESYPELGKTVYGPAGNPKEGPNLAKEYMTPHEAGTDRPTPKAKVQDIRYFVDPAERKAKRETKLKEVNTVLKDMAGAAEKVGVPPEGLFLNKWRDMHRERVRYS